MLRELFPNGHFSPAATLAAIEAVETDLGVRLPEQLRQLYVECDGFREDRGNAKYLLSLTNEDFIGSLLRTTRFWWEGSKVNHPDLDFRPFVFFGYSGSDECWGINWKKPGEIIAYHHHMGNQYEIAGSDIIELFRADYARYDEVAGSAEPGDNS